ncbi:hypothetical protein CEXT_149251 [Caerostris extrusa]|uniref:Uncharacterized protein n=1 Tax=Caerostris extrusa TaxID=172846 RepID=A0AAV4U7J1_CAEEX|nr:hypothetical protein CEXT_149251 [Caerostris extrusa]
MRNTPKPTGPPPDLITVATLTMEYPHMQDSDTSGSVGGGILKAGDLRILCCPNTNVEEQDRAGGPFNKLDELCKTRDIEVVTLGSKDLPTIP